MVDLPSKHQAMPMVDMPGYYPIVDHEQTSEEWLAELKAGDDEADEIKIVAQRMRQAYEQQGSPHPIPDAVWIALAAIAVGK